MDRLDCQRDESSVCTALPEDAMVQLTVMSQMVCPDAHVELSKAKRNALTEPGASYPSVPFAGVPASIFPLGGSDDMIVEYAVPSGPRSVHNPPYSSCSCFDVLFNATFMSTKTSPASLGISTSEPLLVLTLCIVICQVLPTLAVSPTLKCGVGVGITPPGPELVADCDSPQAVRMMSNGKHNSNCFNVLLLVLIKYVHTNQKRERRDKITGQVF